MNFSFSSATLSFDALSPAFECSSSDAPFDPNHCGELKMILVPIISLILFSIAIFYLFVFRGFELESHIHIV